MRPPHPCRRSPGPQLFASHINGEPQANYYRWLALTYVSTLTTHPALSLPCGLDDAGHAVWPADCWAASAPTGHTLGVGHALEQAFKGVAGLARPRPDIAKLVQTRMPNPR